MGSLAEALAYVLIGLGTTLLERARPDVYKCKPGVRVIARRHSRAHRVPGDSDRDTIDTLLAEVTINGRRDWL